MGWVWVLSLLLPGSETLDKSLAVTGPRFPFCDMSPLSPIARVVREFESARCPLSPGPALQGAWSEERVLGRSLQMAKVIKLTLSVRALRF